jgi:tetratricopeptide (TPR) repeat protein
LGAARVVKMIQASEASTKKATNDVARKEPKDSTQIALGVQQRLQFAKKLRAEGKVSEAKQICSELVRAYPDHVRALHELGLLHMAQKEYDLAIDFLSRGAMHCPRHVKILGALANCYFEVEAYEMAAHILDIARKLQEDSPKVHLALGKVLHAQRDFERAATHLERALKLNPDMFLAAFQLGRCYENLDRLSDAADIYLRSLAMAPGSRLQSISALSDLPPSLVPLDLLQLIEQVENTGDGNDSKIDLYFAKARILDKLGRFDEAWSYARMANAEVFKSCANKLKGEEARRARVMDWARGSARPAIPAVESIVTDPTPLFILGPSRSGKSIVEQFLKAFNAVRCGHENLLVQSAVRLSNQLSGYLSSGNFASLPADAYPVFSRIYGQELRRRAGHAAVFTTSSPGLLDHVPRILAAMPRSKFVFVKRDVNDLALRIFFKKYERGHYFSYDVSKIYSYIAFYHALIDIYLNRFPENSILVRYEDMVANPSTTAHRLAQFCSIDEELDVVPDVGNDVGCSAPYLDKLKTAAHTS